jgi:hypothetical protein
MESGRLTYSHTFGMADLQAGVPLTIDSVFSVGSMSKQFTAMSVILLIEDGKVALTGLTPSITGSERFISNGLNNLGIERDMRTTTG